MRWTVIHSTNAFERVVIRMSKNRSKKINPNRRPCTGRDLKKSRDEGVNLGFTAAVACIFMALHDKEGYGRTRLKRVLDEASGLLESVGEKCVTLEDLLITLRRETGINFVSDGCGTGADDQTKEGTGSSREQGGGKQNPTVHGGDR